MKALFLTPIEENKKQQFLDTGIECIFKEKKSVTKEDFKDIDIVFGNPDLNMIKEIYDNIRMKGYTVVPVRMYLKNGRAKLEIALAKGKNLYDKRQSDKIRDAKREMEKALKFH